VARGHLVLIHRRFWDHGNVVVPTWERASLEVVEPELALELLVRLLRPVALLDRAYDPLLAHPPGQGREGELRGPRLPLRPLHHQPDLLVLGGVNAVLLRNLHPAKAEARGQLSIGSLSPRNLAKRVLRSDTIAPVDVFLQNCTDAPRTVALELLLPRPPSLVWRSPGSIVVAPSEVKRVRFPICAAPTAREAHRMYVRVRTRLGLRRRRVATDNHRGQPCRLGLWVAT
jgi:hypothetical protein